MDCQGICIAIFLLGEISSLICLCLIEFEFDGIQFAAFDIMNYQWVNKIKRDIRCHKASENTETKIFPSLTDQIQIKQNKAL